MCEIYWTSKEYTNKKEGKSGWWHKKKNEDENTKEEEVDKTLGTMKDEVDTPMP